MSNTITVMRNGKITLEIATKDADENKLAQAMIDKEIIFNYKKYKTHNVAYDKVIYKVQNLSTINSKKQKIVDDVSFQIHEGEILGIAGIEGNGQSELIQLLTGLIIATKGTIFFKARSITHLLPHEIRKVGIRIIPEDRFEQGLCKTMSIAANCIAGYHDKCEVCKFGLLRTKNIDDKKIKFIDKFDIRVGNADGNIENLSGGNAQKIILAREFE